MVYPTLLQLLRTPRLPVFDWTDAPADLNGPLRFADRRNLVSSRVPSHFKRSLHDALKILLVDLDKQAVNRKKSSVKWYRFLYSLTQRKNIWFEISDSIKHWTTVNKWSQSLCWPNLRYYRGADKFLARSDWKSKWKFAIFRPTRGSMLPRRPGWTDNILNCLWMACKS